MEHEEAEGRQCLCCSDSHSVLLKGRTSCFFFPTCQRKDTFLQTVAAADPEACACCMRNMRVIS